MVISMGYGRTTAWVIWHRQLFSPLLEGFLRSQIGHLSGKIWRASKRTSKLLAVDYGGCNLSSSDFSGNVVM